MKLCLVRSFLTLTDERAIIKLGLKTGAGSSQGKSAQAPIRFVILHSVYDSLSRLAAAIFFSDFERFPKSNMLIYPAYTRKKVFIEI